MRKMSLIFRNSRNAGLLTTATAVALLTISGCQLFTGPGTCHDDVKLTVSEGTEPTFTWDPACGAVSLEVRRGVGGPTVWSIFGSDYDGRSFRPPVRYGVAPEGVEQQTLPSPLQPGERYEIVVSGSRGTDLILLTVARAVFIP